MSNTRRNSHSTSPFVVGLSGFLLIIVIYSMAYWASQLLHPPESHVYGCAAGYYTTTDKDTGTPICVRYWTRDRPVQLP